MIGSECLRNYKFLSQKMSEGNYFGSGRGKLMPSVPNFHFGTIQNQHGISAYLPPSIQYSLSASRTIQSGGSVIRPRASAPLPGESYGIFSPPPPNLSRAMPRMKTSSSCESESRPRGREKNMGSSVESLASQLSSESYGFPAKLNSPILSSAAATPSQEKRKEGRISKSSTTGSVHVDAPSILDPRHKQRAQGFERFEEISDKNRRKVSQSQQIKQVKIDLARLLLTTGCHSCLLIVPPSWKVHKYATAGDFNTFIQMYASALEAQQKLKRSDTKLQIDELWERFHGRSGLHHIEVLCGALLESGCDDMVVEHFKDAYLSSLAGEQSQMIEAKKKLSTCLNDALRTYVSLEMSG